MAHDWIRAALALRYVAGDQSEYEARLRICERAHAGLIGAKADVVVWQGQEERDRSIPKDFWWAEGNEALEQDWQAGDFATWIDQKIEVKAFGVSFDFTALSDLVPTEKKAAALRSISVIGEDEWISSGELYQLLLGKYGPSGKARLALESALSLGQISGRALRATRYRSPLRDEERAVWGAVEWDVPLSSWQDFTSSKETKFDWAIGTLSWRLSNNQGAERMEVQGLHFHRSGLINLGLVDSGEGATGSAEGKRGRKASYDWRAACTAIWGQIHRGELIPENQAQVERAFQVLLTKGDKEPSESTVRPYAREIWEEYSKA